MGPLILWKVLPIQMNGPIYILLWVPACCQSALMGQFIFMAGAANMLEWAPLMLWQVQPIHLNGPISLW